MSKIANDLEIMANSEFVKKYIMRDEISKEIGDDDDYGTGVTTVRMSSFEREMDIVISFDIARFDNDGEPMSETINHMVRSCVYNGEEISLTTEAELFIINNIGI